MPNTYSQMYVQLVFATKHRQKLIHKTHKNEIEKYITGTITNLNCKLLSIYMMPDHIHILINYQPNQNISEIVKEIKRSSTVFINNQKWIDGKFQWQEGFGAFTYSLKEIDRVIKYINNQEEHHQKKNFKKEYLTLLNTNKINYVEEYLFKWLDE